MAIYYVSLAGNDGNSCPTAQSTAQSSAKRTINAGLGCLAAGDILYIRAGTYDEQILEASFGGSGTSWSAPVTVAAYPGETVIVRPTSGTGNVVGFPLATSGTISYAIFDRLIFDGEACGGDGGAAVAYLESSTHHIRFTQCHFRNGAGNGVLATLGSHSLEFLDCEAYRNGLFPGYLISNGLYLECSNSVVRGGRFYNNEAFGIRLYASAGTSSTTTIERTRCYQNGRGLGLDGTSISTADGGGIVAGDLNPRVVNNLVYGNYHGILIYTEAVGAVVHHNTIYGHVGDGLAYQFYGASPAAYNNISVGNGVNRVDYGGTGTPDERNNLFSGDPATIFVDAVLGDFQLLPTSPAVNAGFSGAGVVDDFTGIVTRPQGPAVDTGAYERVVGGGTGPMTGVSLSAAPVSPQPVTTPIVFTAVGTGGTAPYSFRFLVQVGSTGPFLVLRDWGVSPTVTWTPIVAGVFNHRVEARSVGATAVEVFQTVTYQVTGGPVAAPGPATNLRVYAA